MINISEIYSDCLNPNEMTSMGNTGWQLLTSPLTTLRFWSFCVLRKHYCFLTHLCNVSFIPHPKYYLSLCYFQRAYWDNHEGSHISSRTSQRLLDLPNRKGLRWALIKPHMFLTNMPGPSCAASLAQHGVCTRPSAQSPQPRHTWGTCSSPPCKPHMLHGCALEPEKIAFWHLSSQTSKAMSNSWKLDSLFKTGMAISTESNQAAL